MANDTIDYKSFFSAFSIKAKIYSCVGTLCFALAVIVVFAAMDELLQRSIQGRYADGLDYISDIAGGGLVLLTLWGKDFILSRRNQKKYN